MDLYLMLWVKIQYCFIAFVAQSIPVWPLGALSIGSYAPLTSPIEERVSVCFWTCPYFLQGVRNGSFMPLTNGKEQGAQARLTYFPPQSWNQQFLQGAPGPLQKLGSVACIELAWHVGSKWTKKGCWTKCIWYCKSLSTWAFLGQAKGRCYTNRTV